MDGSSSPRAPAMNAVREHGDCVATESSSNCLEIAALETALSCNDSLTKAHAMSSCACAKSNNTAIPTDGGDASTTRGKKRRTDLAREEPALVEPTTPSQLSHANASINCSGDILQARTQESLSEIEEASLRGTPTSKLLMGSGREGHKRRRATPCSSVRLPKSSFAWTTKAGNSSPTSSKRSAACSALQNCTALPAGKRPKACRAVASRAGHGPSERMPAWTRLSADAARSGADIRGARAPTSSASATRASLHKPTGSDGAEARTSNRSCEDVKSGRHLRSTATAATSLASSPSAAAAAKIASLLRWKSPQSSVCQGRSTSATNDRFWAASTQVKPKQMDVKFCCGCADCHIATSFNKASST
mmetsp:Transcript_155127/g.497434  ORF Transcript_155127/g.497434 Transcript_155127/m.497434 type:complete len:363 (+) Transcript_155127:802-1890(+)